MLQQRGCKTIEFEIMIQVPDLLSVVIVHDDVGLSTLAVIDESKVKPRTVLPAVSTTMR